MSKNKNYKMELNMVKQVKTIQYLCTCTSELLNLSMLDSELINQLFVLSFTKLTRLNPIMHCDPDVCGGEHPAVAMVSAEVWEEDGGVLWNHSELVYFCSD